jgi:hypothetical protein
MQTAVASKKAMSRELNRISVGAKEGLEAVQPHPGQKCYFWPNKKTQPGD